MRREIWSIDINRGDGEGWSQYITEYSKVHALRRLGDERDWSKRVKRTDKYRLTRYVPERKSK